MSEDFEYEPEQPFWVEIILTLVFGVPIALEWFLRKISEYIDHFSLS